MIATYSYVKVVPEIDRMAFCTNKTDWDVIQLSKNSIAIIRMRVAKATKQ